MVALFDRVVVFFESFRLEFYWTSISCVLNSRLHVYNSVLKSLTCLILQRPSRSGSFWISIRLLYTSVIGVWTQWYVFWMNA